MNLLADIALFLCACSVLAGLGWVFAWIMDIWGTD